MIDNIRTALHFLRYTALHPQWFAYRYERKRYEQAGRLSNGRILDIGCGHQTVRKYLNPSTSYFSLDSQKTGVNLYNAMPSIFGDAGSLPFIDETFDVVILFEVLEHVADPVRVVQESRRILKKDGMLILSTPFLYPMHDVPHDYHRFTRFGLEHLLLISELTIHDFQTLGNPIETGVLLCNLSLAWLTLHSPFLFRLPLLLLSVIVIPLLNIIALALSPIYRLCRDSPFAIGYLVVARRRF